MSTFSIQAGEFSPLSPQQREFLRLIYLGGLEACPSSPGRCAVVQALIERRYLGRDGLTALGRDLGKDIADRAAGVAQ